VHFSHALGLIGKLIFTQKSRFSLQSHKFFVSL